VLAGPDRDAVEPLVLLHVGQVHEQFERRAGQHLIDAGVAMGDGELLRPVGGAIGDLVTRADELNERAGREVREVLRGHAAAPDHTDLDPPPRRLLRGGRRLRDGRARARRRDPSRADRRAALHEVPSPDVLRRRHDIAPVIAARPDPVARPAAS
jgi:hypothetical protein